MSRPISGTLPELWNVMGPPGRDAPPPREPRDGIDGKDAEPIVPMGEWKYQTQYPRLALVFWEDDSYLAREPSKGREPSETSKYWQLIARSIKGERGKDGHSTYVKKIVREQESSEPIATTFLSKCPLGTPIILDSEGRADKAAASGSFASANVMGVSLGNNSFVASGIVTQNSWADIVESGQALLVPNGTLYLSLIPGKLTYNSPTNSGAYSVVVAKCVSKNSIHLDVEYPVAL